MILKFKDPNNNATVIIDNIEKVEIDTENYSVKYPTDDASIKWYLRLPELLDERTQKVYYGANLQYPRKECPFLQVGDEFSLRLVEYIRKFGKNIKFFVIWRKNA